MEERDNLEELKGKYETLKVNYSLPDFDSLNLDFQIERLVEVETDYLIREIRKLILEKFSDYSKLIGTIISPTDAPLSVLSIAKLMNLEEKSKLLKIYSDLSKKAIIGIQLDLNFSEEKEIEFIKESYNLWGEVRGDLLQFFERIEKDWDSKRIVNGKSYFG